MAADGAPSDFSRRNRFMRGLLYLMKKVTVAESSDRASGQNLNESDSDNDSSGSIN